MSKRQKNKMSDPSPFARRVRDEAELNEWKRKAEEYLNGWKRAKADYINREQEIKKLRESDKERFKEIFVLELLPVADNFETALRHVPPRQDVGGEQPAPNREAPNEPWLAGIFHIKKQFEDFLKNLGLERIETVGKEFDTNLHEAVDSVQNKDSSESIEEANAKTIVIKEILAGYKLGERVIRPAKVIVR